MWIQYLIFKEIINIYKLKKMILTIYKIVHILR